MDQLFLGPSSNFPQISKAVAVEYDEAKRRQLKVYFDNDKKI